MVVVVVPRLRPPQFWEPTQKFLALPLPGVAVPTVLARLPILSLHSSAFELSHGRSFQSSGTDFSYPQGS